MPASAHGPWIVLAALALTIVAEVPRAQAGPCQAQWVPTFGSLPGTDWYLWDQAVFDDGAGPALYVAGRMEAVAGQRIAGLARWDGRCWSEVGPGQPQFESVTSLAVFDDGAGPALYAAGSLVGTPLVAELFRWDGSTWSPLSPQMGFDSAVLDMLVFDDGLGQGPALYVAGRFAQTAGVAVNNLARWDGQTWSGLGSGVTGGSVSALAAYDDGTGAALYAGGSFKSAGGLGALNVAKWAGGTWSALAGGVQDSVNDLAVFDFGAGPKLYAGSSLRGLHSWNGWFWSTHGGPARVNSLLVHDDGQGGGPALYAGGWEFAASNLQRFNGSSWDSTVGGGVDNRIDSLASFDPGGGALLCVAGWFAVAGNVPAASFATWDGRSWSGRGGTGPEERVTTLLALDAGLSGAPELYAGGDFLGAGGQVVRHIARWGGGGWSPLGTGIELPYYGLHVRALALYDHGTGPALFAAGSISLAGGMSTRDIARWDGTSWSALGTGVSGYTVHALCVYDDGTGPKLYVGGEFTSAGRVLAQNIACWDGTAWSSVGTGMNWPVHALCVYDDGNGPKLYAGGAFTSAGGFPAQYLAKWGGTAWSGVGGGTDAEVDCLKVFDDGSGPALYVGGGFNHAGGVNVNRIARWDGSSWSALAWGFWNPAGHCTVHALAGFDAGARMGPALYAAGTFTMAGSVPVAGLARWDGSSWSALSPELAPGLLLVEKSALAVFDNALVSGLVVGGRFATSHAGDSHVALWACPATGILEVPGCSAGAARLDPMSSALRSGTRFWSSLSGLCLAPGVAQLFAGVDGTDPSGCGVALPGLGEVLLGSAPTPLLVHSTTTFGGRARFAVAIPVSPSLQGIELSFQAHSATLVGTRSLQQLSNALRGVVVP